MKLDREVFLRLDGGFRKMGFTPPKPVLFAALASCLFAAVCSGEDTGSRRGDSVEVTALKDTADLIGEAEGSETPGVSQQCFRNEYPFPDAPGTMDVQELVVRIDGEVAAGNYNWLPAFKDQRRGEFHGTMENDVIEATYTFSQEGQVDTARIAIALEAGRAVVEGGAPELGLSASISRVVCPR